MKSGKKIDKWYPLYIDKWLFGSTRHELIINSGWRDRFSDLVQFLPESIKAAQFTDLRGIFQDLLALSKKDGGYIRANELTPYPLEQLAGMWCVPIDYLKLVIKICLDERVNKIKEISSGIFYIVSQKTYELTERGKRKAQKSFDSSENPEPGSENGEPKEEKKGNKNRRNKNIYTQDELNTLFNEFMKRYPNKKDPGKAKEKWLLLVVKKGIPPERLWDAMIGYIRCLNSFNTDPEYVKMAKTFLYAGNEKKKIPGTWEQYVPFADPKYKAKLPL